MSTHRRLAALALPLALAVPLALVSCGVPTGGPPEAIPSSEVPSALASPSTPPSSSVPAQPGTEQPHVYLVTAEDVLVPRPREVPAGGTADRLADLLRDLTEGPTRAERDDQLSTALPPGTELALADLSGSTATISFENDVDAPSGRDSRRTVAQIVLTATSVAGVDEVLLSRDGLPVEAPLPSGELSSAPLTAADYAALLTAPPT
ncbi:GerMN domain-containing protein [Modestobacter roseus]|uniref:GerMN domain-containing protein n=1 Tax=Modestobacter roseus TaxID=1181884 RepID=UPI0034DE7B6F